ncbi:MAG: hypothetical protein LUD51_00945 [Clostridia bacterium]|nr:hypothetical protein [Clostridia bacterium]
MNTVAGYVDILHTGLFCAFCLPERGGRKAGKKLKISRIFYVKRFTNRGAINIIYTIFGPLVRGNKRYWRDGYDQVHKVPEM